MLADVQNDHFERRKNCFSALDFYYIDSLLKTTEQHGRLGEMMFTVTRLYFAWPGGIKQFIQALVQQARWHRSASAAIWHKNGMNSK